jgi:cytochrome oxidase Cu insertion factor (SCO1/SenC/PrrC family)
LRNALLVTILLTLPATTSVADEAQFVSPYIASGQRSGLANGDITYTDHAGQTGVIRELLDKPAVITFFYTRCQNMKKCSMAVNRLGVLQRRLAQAGIADRVRLVAISYEPQFDTPERLNRYATDRGLDLGSNAVALRLDQKRHRRLVEELNAPANYNAGWINTHGVELNLVDARGRVVRKYHTVLWDDDQVLADLQRVLGEE